ncbi:Crp/Fnr family transcriptional regulator [Fusibacter sp. 3D3]|uniref:Crp/Fnr family transcriptional regulator n=1 Tax=Fusibacter sp. 3D3 TaxID=1048380 RepID=UPI0008537C8B|nr:cyclic nucleotide-binding domain-containing protein [Fusibacter sp. 3D3]GAU77067.1 cAMP-binding proteins [Fusibacter sp. 3D3]
MNDALRKIGSVVQFKQDDIIFFEGEPGDAIYILLSGSVIACRTSDIDGRMIVLATLNTGAVFGEMAVIHEHKRSATIIAQAPILALRIDKANFGQFIMLEPKYAINMLKTLAGRIECTRSRCGEKGC